MVEQERKVIGSYWLLAVALAVYRHCARSSVPLRVGLIAADAAQQSAVLSALALLPGAVDTSSGVLRRSPGLSIPFRVAGLEHQLWVRTLSSGPLGHARTDVVVPLPGSMLGSYRFNAGPVFHEQVRLYYQQGSRLISPEPIPHELAHGALSALVDKMIERGEVGRISAQGANAPVIAVISWLSDSSEACKASGSSLPRHLFEWQSRTGLYVVSPAFGPYSSVLPSVVTPNVSARWLGFWDAWEASGELQDVRSRLKVLHTYQRAERRRVRKGGGASGSASQPRAPLPPPPCPICGSDLPPRGPKSRGRPRKFCSEACERRSTDSGAFIIVDAREGGWFWSARTNGFVDDPRLASVWRARSSAQSAIARARRRGYLAAAAGLVTRASAAFLEERRLLEGAADE